MSTPEDKQPKIYNLEELAESLAGVIGKESIELGHQWVSWIKGVVASVSLTNEQGFKVDTSHLRFEAPEGKFIVLRASEVYETKMGIDSQARYKPLGEQIKLESGELAVVDYMNIFVPRAPENELTATAFGPHRYYDSSIDEEAEGIWSVRKRYVFDLDRNLVALPAGKTIYY